MRCLYVTVGDGVDEFVCQCARGGCVCALVCRVWCVALRWCVCLWMCVGVCVCRAVCIGVCVGVCVCV